MTRTNTKNGYNFAEFIVRNDLYNKDFFADDYEDFLDYPNNKQGFWESFEYAMRVDFDKPIKE